MLPYEEEIINLKSTFIDPLYLKELAGKDVCAEVLRLDKIHPVVSGNKWFKLKYHLREAQKRNIQTILTFGGAYSNHIVATAYAANGLGLKSIGIIRGNKLPAISHTLLHAKSYGMQLEFVGHDEYKKRNEAGFQKMLAEKFEGCFIIPEGGAGANGIKGSAEILHLVNSDAYSHILCAVGTGTMFSGLANDLGPDQTLIGVCVLKGMQEEYKSLIDESKRKGNREINHDYHSGGYAKKNDALIQFMNGFYEQTGVPTDFVYTAKLFYAALDLIGRNYFAPQSKLLIIHSGGLQGNASLKPGTLIF